MYTKFCFLMSIVLVLGLMMPATVRAGELVDNPGFETGVETPWYNYTETGGTSAVQTPDAHSGDYWWELTSGTAFISGLQDITSSQPPVPVTFSAYLRNSGTSAVDVEFGFDYSPDPMAPPWWYGQSIIALTLPADNTWYLTSFEEFDTTATGYVGTSITSRPVADYIMKVKVALVTPSSTLDIDDASAIPEPATLALLGLGALVIRRRKR